MAYLKKLSENGLRIGLPFGLIALTSLVLFAALEACKPKPSRIACLAPAMASERMFTCDSSVGLMSVQAGPASAYFTSKLYYPQSWNQLGYNQAHNSAFPVPGDAPAYLREGRFWSAPLYGLEFNRLRRALATFPPNGGQTWGATVAATLAEVMGVTVVQGILFAQTSGSVIHALDAQTGREIWRRELINVAGMGQAVAADVNGRLILYVPVGDAVFNLENVYKFINNEPHDRGASFGGLFAFDGVTGEPLWDFHTEGAARPSPVYVNDHIHLATSGGQLYVLDPTTGVVKGQANNPGEGFPGLASANWYQTATGSIYIIYGTLRPRRLLAMDVTNPAAPFVAWELNPPGSTKNSPGDTPVAIDQARGLIITTYFTDIGQGASNVWDLTLMAVNAENGQIVWSDVTGTGPNIPGFKASIPLLDGDMIYFGNSLAQNYQAYNIDTGASQWVADFIDPSDPPGKRRRPAGPAILFDGKLIHADGDKIRTLDPTTGQILNVFKTQPQSNAVWPIIQPVLVGEQLYLGSLSGWVFAVPVRYVMNNPGEWAERDPAFLRGLRPRRAESKSPVGPAPLEAAAFMQTWTAHAAGPENNSVTPLGPSGVSWERNLNEGKAYSLAKTTPPWDADIYGVEIASHMTALAFGASAGVTPVNGMLYVGSGAGTARYAVNALNAVTGDTLWTHYLPGQVLGQPLVTPDTVVVSTGDQHMSLGNTANFKAADPTKNAIFTSFSQVVGMDPKTGEEKWTFYSGTGTASMTPLLHKGNLYWVSGDGSVWGINADTGAALDAFVGTNIGGQVIAKNKLPGFNVVSSANIYATGTQDLMIVGMTMPNRMVAIDLATNLVEWEQEFTPFATFWTGFSMSPAIHQATGLVLGSVFVDGDFTLDSVTNLAFALDATTGAIVWTKSLGAGSIPTGFVGSSPVVGSNAAYFFNPLNSLSSALNLADGVVQWETTLANPAPEKYSWGSGVIVSGGTKLVQPVGADLVTIDVATGVVLKTYPVGGSFTYNYATVAGTTYYIGNGWGWVFALPLGTVTGDLADNL